MGAESEEDNLLSYENEDDKPRKWYQKAPVSWLVAMYHYVFPKDTRRIETSTNKSEYEVYQAAWYHRLADWVVLVFEEPQEALNMLLGWVFLTGKVLPAAGLVVLSVKKSLDDTGAHIPMHTRMVIYGIAFVDQLVACFFSRGPGILGAFGVDFNEQFKHKHHSFLTWIGLILRFLVFNVAANLLMIGLRLAIGVIPLTFYLVALTCKTVLSIIKHTAIFLFSILRFVFDGDYRKEILDKINRLTLEDIAFFFFGYMASCTAGFTAFLGAYTLLTTVATAVGFSFGPFLFPLCLLLGAAAVISYLHFQSDEIKKNVGKLKKFFSDDDEKLTVRRKWSLFGTFLCVTGVAVLTIFQVDKAVKSFSSLAGHSAVGSFISHLIAAHAALGFLAFGGHIIGIAVLVMAGITIGNLILTQGARLFTLLEDFREGLRQKMPDGVELKGFMRIVRNALTVECVVDSTAYALGGFAGGYFLLAPLIVNPHFIFIAFAFGVFCAVGALLLSLAFTVTRFFKNTTEAFDNTGIAKYGTLICGAEQDHKLVTAKSDKFKPKALEVGKKTMGNKLITVEHSQDFDARYKYSILQIDLSHGARVEFAMSANQISKRLERSSENHKVDGEDGRAVEKVGLGNTKCAVYLVHADDEKKIDISLKSRASFIAQDGESIYVRGSQDEIAKLLSHMRFFAPKGGEMVEEAGGTILSDSSDESQTDASTAINDDYVKFKYYDVNDSQFKDVVAVPA
ncbi:MAG: hypothetical protein JXR42_02925 [Gammaproteobacteria bacterium]|nr:hypothetical protein [Gammaproteobacteria bacterium]